ncbi:FAD-dependent oxidoreductase [Brevibacterium yomogidense]|uniref:FAD-dependent oxidoreductase n=1 Tax=Brevibacterium yomogidense TaxID=946573 RepID=UPI0018DFFDD5|nr:FAD-dependent oxidoreductase [Brevibacterium yomogidense]
MDSPIVVAGGGAAGRAAVQTLLTLTDQPIVHLAGPSGEAIDRTLVDKALMTGRVSPDRAVAMRPPLDGVDTRFDTLASVAEVPAGSDTTVAEVPVGSISDAAVVAGTGEAPAGPDTAACPGRGSSRLALTLGSGGVLGAAGLIVATGSTPRRLDVPGLEEWVRAERISTLHSVTDALRIRELLEEVDGARVLVSGTGLVGAEAASLLTEAGHHVTLVARSAVPGAAGLGATIAGRLATIHEGAVETRWGTWVVALREGVAALSDGSEVEADLVVVAHGAEPHIPGGLLRDETPDDRARPDGSRGDGSSPDEGRSDASRPSRGGGSARGAGHGSAADAGVPVDDRLRSAGWENVLAAGAVARFGPQPYRVDHWDDAEAQGAHAARTLLHDLGDGDDPGPYRPWSPWSARIHGRQLAGFGHPLPGSTERIVSEDPLLVEFISAADGADTVCAVVGLDAGRALRDHARTIGPHAP